MVVERGYEGKLISKAEVTPTIMTLGSGLKTYTCSQVEVKVEGLKTKKSIPIKHSYCPFCGKSTDKPDPGKRKKRS